MVGGWGAGNKEHICPLSCVDHSPPFNTNFSKRKSSQLLPQQHTARKDLRVLSRGDHIQLLQEGIAVKPQLPGSCSALQLKTVYVQRGWCGWGQPESETRKEPPPVVKQNKRWLLGRFPVLPNSYGPPPQGTSQPLGLNMKLFL